MNSPSNNRQRTARKARRGLSRSFFFLVIPVVLWASGSNGLFSVVPAQDKTYVQLEQLVEAGLLNAGDVAYPLSRYDVAKRILAAQDQYDQRVMAQAGGEIPPPPDALVTSTADSAVPPPSAERPGLAATTGLAGTPVPVLTSIPDGTPVPFGTPVPPHGIQKALKPLTSLKEAYQYELKEVVKAKLLKVQKEADELDSKQYDLRKKIVGVGEYPTLAIHGLGRAFGLSQLYTGAMPGYVTQPGTQTFSGYLDLNPEGVVSKEVGWNTILRLETPMQPNADSVITFRSAAIHFDPSWMSATLGDFEESYTPLVMWNRNTLDLRYVPEMMARQDDTAKYESFLNHEPDWPLRGVKIGTELMWPDSPIVERFQVSAFADMVHDSLNDYGGFIGPGQYTDWIFGGKAYLQSPKQYWEDGSWQWDLSACGLVMDEPLDSNPGLAYDPYNASTWAHQYLIGSVQPGLKVTLGGELTLGATAEFAFSSYQDDKLNSNRIFNDNAFLGGAYIGIGDSRVTFNYLYVDPYFYSPLAQTRQDAVTNLSGLSSMASSGLFSSPLRGQFFLPSIPRAGGIFGYYDRTQDNTFPYGLATPNRVGVGMEVDIRALEQRALRILGSAYLMQEVEDNLVTNAAYTALVPVDAPLGTGSVPARQFTYINAGPSLNLGPLIGWDRDLEIGTNLRMEQTTSGLGNLTSTWILGGFRVDVLPVWEVSAYYGNQTAQGTEEGVDGTLWARYAYVFDGSDLGQYQPFTVNGTNQSWMFTNLFKVNRNSSIDLDLDWTSGNLLPVRPAPGTLNSLFYEVTYEVRF